MMKRVSANAWNWNRTQDAHPDAVRTVADIISAVRETGDEGVRRYTAKYDFSGASDHSWTFRVPISELEAAWHNLRGDLKEALSAAATRIRRFHEAQRPSDIHLTGDDGDELGLVWRSLERVGVYTPGGRAAYPSTVLMNVIPAQVAGVPEIALVTPPDSKTGSPNPILLAAAHLLGVTEVYRIGGSQAIAALAYGTDSIPAVDKIVGPGNLYVALAKRAVMGDVGIDSIAGPSEVFIVADHTARPSFIAADLLAQAEHDPEAGAVLITTEESLLDEVELELSAQLAELPKREIASSSLKNWGAFVIAQTLDEAINAVNRGAPEHLELMVESPKQWLSKVKTAGAVFLGPYTPEPVGDYYAGTNHVLPTFGSAKYASGLGVLDFVRRMSYVSYLESTLEKHQDHIVGLARAEGLDAHAESILRRFSRREGVKS